MEHVNGTPAEYDGYLYHGCARTNVDGIVADGLNSSHCPSLPADNEVATWCLAKTPTLKTEAKTKTATFKTKAKTDTEVQDQGSKNLPRGGLETRQCLKVSDHWLKSYID